MKKMVFWCLAMLAGSAAQANMVLNPGFESNMDNWTTYLSPVGVTSVYFAVKNEAVYDGAWAMKIAARNGYGLIHQTISVPAGAKLNLSLWALAVTGNWMMNEAGDIVDVHFKFMDANGVEISQPGFVAFDGDPSTDAPILTNPDWQEYSVEVDVPANAVSVMLKIRALDGSIDGGTIDGTGVYIDNVLLTSSPVPMLPVLEQTADLVNNKVDATLTWQAANEAGVALADIVDQYVFMSSATDPNLYYIGATGDPGSDPASSFGSLTLEFDSTYKCQVVDVLSGQEKPMVENVTQPSSLDPNSIYSAVWTFDSIASIPVVITNPAGGLISVGDDFIMEAEFQSPTAMTYKWYYSADNIYGDDVELDSTDDSITLNEVAASSQGYYYCAAVNASTTTVNSAMAYLEVGQLVLSYPMENSLDDVVGINHATPSSTEPLVYVTGVVGDYAVSFNGTTQFAVMPWVVYNSFTIEYWVKTTSVGGTGQWFNGIGLIDGEMSGTVNDFGTTVLSGKLAFGVGNPDTTIVSTASINDDQWHHCVATRDHVTGEMAIYVDGEMENYLANGPAGTRKAANDLRIGKKRFGTGYLNGAIDAVRMYNFPMSEIEVADLYYEYTGKKVCIQSDKPENDLNDDCVINIADFAVIAEAWLESGLYQGQ